MAKQTIRISGEISDYTAWRIDQFLADNKGKAVVVRLALPKTVGVTKA